MTRLRSLLLVGLATWCAVAIARTAEAQVSVFPSREVRIEIVVDATVNATVREEYAIDGVPEPIGLQYLSDRCASVGDIQASLGGQPVVFEQERRGPWVMLRGRASSGAGTSLRLQYIVTRGAADARIPIVMPSAMLARTDGGRGADVAMTVSSAEGRGNLTVLFPRFDRDEAGTRWSSQFLAIPSTVRVRAPFEGPERCAPASDASAGGLEWRFWLFTGLMAVWVPVYLWLFGRRTEEAA